MRTNSDTPLEQSRSLLINRQEAARLLGVSPGTIDNLRTQGELPSIKIGTRRLYDVTDLIYFIESRKEMQE